MSELGTIYLGPHRFQVVRAEFCWIDRGLAPVLWDFNVYGHCDNDNDDHPVFPAGVMLCAEGVPLPLSPTDDFTGFAFQTPIAAYPDSGKSYFSLSSADDHYETWDIELRIAIKKETRYLIEFRAQAASNQVHELRIFAWSELVHWRTEPKTDYPMWLRASPSELRDRNSSTE